MANSDGRADAADGRQQPKRDLGVRTRAFALRIIRAYEALPKTGVGQTIGRQVLRSGTSVGAHVAESTHAKSRADFTCKIDGAKQELEETVYWLDLLSDSGAVKSNRLAALKAESRELMAIFVTMAKKTRRV
jgi:four helix bundle protein